jgi:DNA-binding CsgD family transcriptional regulator
VFNPASIAPTGGGSVFRHFSAHTGVKSGMSNNGRQYDMPRDWLAPDPTRHRLTKREQQIALLVADGLKDAIIARRLGIGPRTVATYVRRVQYRLGVDGRDALAAWVTARRDPDHPEAGLRREADARPT